MGRRAKSLEHAASVDEYERQCRALREKTRSREERGGGRKGSGGGLEEGGGWRVGEMGKWERRRMWTGNGVVGVPGNSVSVEVERVGQSGTPHFEHAHGGNVEGLCQIQTASQENIGQGTWTDAFAA